MDATTLIIIIGSLALLMFGMKVLSESLQKMCGASLRALMQRLTGHATNRLSGVLTGTVLTATTQSSTATTVTTLSFVNAGSITLAQAICVILGAHIGTTVTAWMMTVGFVLDTSSYAFAAAFLGIVLSYTRRWKSVGELLFGAAFIFLSLSTISANVSALSLSADRGLMRLLHSPLALGPAGIVLYLFGGILLAMLTQSSAAVTAITMTLSATGALPVESGIVIVLGSNFGTTITANIAARHANAAARRAAAAHLLTNAVGVAWVLCLLHPFFTLTCLLLGTGHEAAATQPYEREHAPLLLAAFHTAFNLANTLLLIPFVPAVERLVCRLIKPKRETVDEEARLAFITGGLLSTPELSILNAKKEISVFAERLVKMYGYVRHIIHAEQDGEADRLMQRVEKYENIADNMEIEIANFLDRVSEGRLSTESKAEIQHMLREVSELESIGDACYKIARTAIRQRHAADRPFTEQQTEHITNMMTLTSDALDQMNTVVRYGEQRYVDLNKSYNFENEINNYRTQLKTQNIVDINNHLYDYQTGVYYTDIISECEKLGDYIINVIESTGIREKKANGF